MSKKNMSSAHFTLLLGLVLTGFLAAGTAVAQQGGTNSTIKSSTSRTPDTFNDTLLAPARIDSFQTRLLGLLQGDQTRYYDQTFDYAFGSAQVNDGLTAAMMALTAANSGNPLSYVGPTLDGSVTSPSSNTVINQIGDPLITYTPGLGSTIGPDIIAIGDLGRCSGLQTAVFSFPYVGGFDEVTDYPFDCTGGAGQLFEVVAGTNNLNVNLNSQYLFTRTIQTIDTYQTFETWRLIGVPQAVSVPEPGTLPLLGLGLAALLTAGGMRRARRRT